MKTFLNKIAEELLCKLGNSLTDITIVLPNKRSKIFLIKEIEKITTQTIFAPNICSIQEFTERISGIRSLDDIEQLFEFYNVYTEVIEASERQPFEQFASWAKILLKDFNDIDAYLIEPEKILEYIKEIKDIENWSPSEKKTEMVEKYLKFWDLLPKFHSFFYEYQIQNKKGYQGLICREATKNIENFVQKNKQEFFVFAGFNALMPSEEKIIQYLLSENKAKIYWDIDRYFLENRHSQSGYFIRKIKEKWSYYKSNPLEWIFDEFSKEKNIHIIGTSKSIGQAKVVGEIIEKQLTENPESIHKTALILSEKSLLIPILYALPKNVDNLNITLEYSARNNPIQFLINRIFRMHTFAKSQNPSVYTFYYKDVLEVLSNPFVEPFAKSNQLVEKIKYNNFTFITHQKLYELNQNKNNFFEIIFEKWNDDALSVLDKISGLLLLIKQNLNENIDYQRVTITFIFEIYKIINQLKNYFSIAPETATIENVYSIYRQIVDTAEVSFEGEPLSGLQIMGILESRTLDFENIIFTSVNEGKIPFGKSQNSFIPYDVKKEKNLPTYQDRDAIYTYHFYRLLSRAKNIFLIYNTESEGLDGGEKSRFITQLKIEKQANHTITEEIYNAELPIVAYHPQKIEKSDLVMQRLKEIAENGFSPSSLATYLRNPMDFYYQKILKINENKGVEETIEANTLGKVIHNTLEELYQPYINKKLEIVAIEQMELQSEEVLKNKFHQLFKEGDLSRGKNLLALEATKVNVLNFLKREKEEIRKGDQVMILALEHKLERVLEDQRLPFPIKISGFIDRIEKRNNIIQIIDYKTGKIEPKNLVLSNWNDLLKDQTKNKIIQILSYVFMYEEFANKLPIKTGIISFKNITENNFFMPFRFKENPKDKRSEQETIITPFVLDDFKTEIIKLLLEILNPKIPFEQNEV